MKNTDFKIVNGFENGSFRIAKYYSGVYGKLPNKFVSRLAKCYIDLDKIDIEKVKEKYPNAICNLTSISNENKTSAVEEYDDFEETEIYTPSGNWENTELIIFDDSVIYEIDRDTIIIYYDDQDFNKLYKDLYDFLPKCEDKPKEAEVKLVAYNNEYYTVRSKIKNLDINIEENYNDDFIPVYEDIKTFISDRECGLIILRGNKGTGKTSLIKHLISSIPKNYILVTNVVAEHLASPEFISFMLEHKDSIFILEDCEQILMKRTDGFGENGAIANILNMSDGIMSDIFNIKFICTFNADIDKIDEALLRKGRCYANYEFKALSKDKTEHLLNKLGIHPEEVHEMTLADIYHYHEGDYSDNKPIKRIGF